MGWRQASTRARDAGERRLRTLSRDWRPLPHPESVIPAQTRIEVPDVGWPQDPASDRGARGPAPARGWTAPMVRGLVVVVLLALAIAGYGIWSGRPRAVAVAPTVQATGAPLPGATTAEAEPPSTPTATGSPGSGGASPDASVAVAVVVVHVIGKVRRPGLVTLPAGSRVADAVDAAGGVTVASAASTVNLARVLVDGEQVAVGVPAAAEGGAAGGAGAGSGALPVVNLNTATLADLDTLPGVGPVLAARILSWRTTNGPFRSVDELGEVSGIGDAILANLRPLVRV
jgi:competence protein ComEA